MTPSFLLMSNQNFVRKVIRPVYRIQPMKGGLYQAIFRILIAVYASTISRNYAPLVRNSERGSLSDYVGSCIQ